VTKQATPSKRNSECADPIGVRWCPHLEGMGVGSIRRMRVISDRRRSSPTWFPKSFASGVGQLAP
jgi:hypothetical protein